MYSGPHIKRDGLVFGYDTGANPSSNFDHKNKKRRFFKGSASTNVVTNTNLNTGWSKGYQTAIEYDEIKPPKGIKSQVVGFNKSSSSSYWYSYGDYAPQTPNTTYTVSMFVKTRDSNFRITFYTANNSETGRVWGSYITVPNDNKWHRIVWPSFLNPSNSQSDSLSFNFSMADTGDSSRTWFCAPQMEVGTKASPFVEGTRSSTQSLIDLTKSTTIDVSNVSFDSDGLPTFDGTDDRIELTGFTQTPDPNNFSVEAVVNLNSHNSNTNIGSVIVNNYSSLRGWIFYLDGPDSRLGLRHHYNGTSGAYSIEATTGINLNQWYHIMGTDDGTTVRLYINGVQVQSGNSTTATNYSGQPLIGQFPGNNSVTNGKIPVAKIYNRALTAQEVKQNFKAYKNRFNL